MKKLLASLLALILILSVALPVLAEGDWTIIDPKENRKIKLKAVTDPEVEEGISPTTGLPLEDYTDLPETYQGLAVTGRYLPMMVQIDNTDGGVASNQPWGVAYADVIYESPLQRSGFTRISYIFSDVIPDAVGPVRSARVGHVWLREEWGAGFLYYGGQTRKGSSIKDEFNKYHSNYMTEDTVDPAIFNDKALKAAVEKKTKLIYEDKNGNGKKDKGESYIAAQTLFSGTDGASKPWKKGDGLGYDKADIPGRAKVHSMNANVAAMSKMINEYYAPKVHAFRFTDELPEGDDATEIRITWGHVDYGSNLIYDVDTNTYFRYMRYKDEELVPYQDLYTEEQAAFSNVIIQHITMSWNGAKDAPVTDNVGEGNADFFMGGKHIAGYWKRASMEERTVFYGPDGNEIELQRGKTFISMFPEPDPDKAYKKVVKEVAYRAD